MREIKFRAWVLSDNRYYYFTLNEILERALSYQGAFDINILKSEHKEQFTGLRDKNGKEIYEGDIIGHKDSDFLRVVKWSSLLPAFTVERAGFRECVWYNEKYAKVVGNIHENPELLDNA